MSYNVLGLREDNILMLEASLELREALCVSCGEDQIAGLDVQAA